MFASLCGHVDLKKALDFFNFGKVRTIVLDSGNWFFPGFFSFQYGPNFNENSKVHQSILKIYEAEKISLENCYNIDNQTFKDLTSSKPLKEVKNRVKDKDKEKDNSLIFEKGGVGEKTFDIFRKAYPGVRSSLEKEFQNFRKKYPAKKIVELMPGLQREIEWREKAKAAGQFVPEWKYLTTWINNECWNQEFPEVKTDASLSQNGTIQKPNNQDQLRINSGVVDVAEEKNRKYLEAQKLATA